VHKLGASNRSAGLGARAKRSIHHIPYTTTARGADLPELREQAGTNELYRVRVDR